jgi:hypothetical protein
MATFSPTLQLERKPSLATRAEASQAAFLGACSAIAFLLLGYHPYSEDGGIYSAAAALRLNPSLFPHERDFAIGQTGRSLFVPIVTSVAQRLHTPLATTLLLLHIAAIVATITAASWLVRALFRSTTTQRWSVLTLAAALGLPIAGTSLYLCDPYLTARSFSTPLLLLVTGAMLRRQYRTASICLALACAIHPLMGACATVLFLLIWARQTSRPVLAPFLACIAVLAAMAAIHFFSPAETSAARAAALTRGYWFLARWQWYELLGLIAPPLLLLWLARRPHGRPSNTNLRDVALATACATLTVTIGALLFIHPQNTSFLLARLQPLRLLHPVYAIFILLLAGRLAESRWRRLAWLPAAAAAIGLITLQLQTYPGSGYLELPGRPAVNLWTQAFQWAGDNTPVDAVFALDAHYTTAPGEDAQLFRAIALRTQLPDAAKDGGISSVMTSLATRWQLASQAQTGLDRATDADRLTRLRQLGATWIVLPAKAATTFHCPYRNEAAKVCRLY